MRGLTLAVVHARAPHTARARIPSLLTATVVVACCVPRSWACVRVCGGQVLSCEGSGSDMDIFDGIDWSVNHALTQVPRRPGVISMSLGGATRSAMIDYAVKQADSYGLLVVVAGGNEGPDADACEGY